MMDFVLFIVNVWSLVVSGKCFSGILIFLHKQMLQDLLKIENIQANKFYIANSFIVLDTIVLNFFSCLVYFYY